ncbi:tetratricopeptide repeat protein [Desulfococcaceae bacterium HSG8]|nr:tetratricopeptide repeat protein [Desulfococcaceae bacterium HSG8]
MKKVSGVARMNIYISLIIVGSAAVGFMTSIPYHMPNSYVAFITTVLCTALYILVTFLITKRWMEKKYEEMIDKLKDDHQKKTTVLKKEHDMITLEKTIRDGTQTLIKNALDYFKLENIKNEMGDSAAIANLQLDKYGQIIELLADFSLILPDINENQQIVQQEINHQIDIYQIDEKPFAMFLKRIMDKYIVTLNKKIREKADQNSLGLMKTCPQCAERVLLKANVCKHCGYEFKALARTPAHNTIALDRVEKGKNLYRAGKYREAINELSSAIELKPDYAVAYYNRAIVYYKLGDMKLAESDLKEASYLGHKKAKEFLKVNLEGRNMEKIKPPRYRMQ